MYWIKFLSLFSVATGCDPAQNITSTPFVHIIVLFLESLEIGWVVVGFSRVASARQNYYKDAGQLVT
jgi:hypothetical protein